METINTFGLPFYRNGGKIHIKKENRGKFTAAAKRAGKSVQAYASQILANKERYSPTLVKRANFARNAAKFKHEAGGIVTPYGQWEYPGEVTIIPSNEITMNSVNYPVLGISNTGERKLMLPWMNYKFNGNYVTEYPIMQNGGWANFKQLLRRTFDKDYRNAPTLEGDFNTAFNTARRSDVPVFKWNNKYYNTNIAPIGDIINSFIEQINNKYKYSNWGNVLKDDLYSKIVNDKSIKFPIADIAELIGDESSYDKYNSKNEFVGPLQMNEYWFSRIYGDQGKAVYNEYKNKTRKDEDIAEDMYQYIKMMNDRLPDNGYGYTYGRFKVNQYAPNAGFDDVINNAVWNSNVIHEINNGIVNGSNLKKGVSTYRDLATEYDRMLKERRNNVKKLEGSFVPLPTVDNKITDYSRAMAKGLFEGNNIANIVGTTLGAASTLAASIGGAVRAKKQGNTDTSTNTPSNTAESTFVDPFVLKNPLERTMRDATGIDNMKFKFRQQGGMPSTQAIIEGGEIVDYPDGTQLIDTGEQHEYSGERTYRPDGKIDGDPVEFTGIPMIDLKNNPNLKLLSFGANPWAQGEPFIWPSTVNQKGYVNTKVDNYFPEAHQENKINFAQFGGLMQQPFKKPARIKRK